MPQWWCWVSIQLRINTFSNIKIRYLASFVDRAIFSSPYETPSISSPPFVRLNSEGGSRPPTLVANQLGISGRQTISVASTSSLHLHRPVRAGGGRILQYSHVCESLTSDSWVLSTVRCGYRLEFSSPPSVGGPRPTTMPTDLDKRSAFNGRGKRNAAQGRSGGVGSQSSYESTLFLT